MHTPDAVVGAILAIPIPQKRRLVAIVGAPGSGKSTLAQTLCEKIPRSCVLPMDGFHRGNDDLKHHGLFERKGAPETFDVAGLTHVLEAAQLPQGAAFPTFDRAGDCTVPDGGAIHAHHETVLVEGNYLLYDQPPWNGLARFWDASIFLDVSFEVLEARLIQRWRDYGFSPEQALRRAHQNDLVNARAVLDHSRSANFDLTV
ncbi:hypothetical protein [Algirhabdus cladophorae]|uniref:hypothetical protein n=1 Tax=Algirhabdus cladophorae TaxID=3377108 RepID=UPI003B845D20